MLRYLFHGVENATSFGEIIIAINCFCKMLHQSCLTGSEYASHFEYASILNIPGL